MSSTEIGGRMPTSSALSDGTASVRSPWATRNTRYSFFSPKATRISFFSITAAPWWGYTTWSPTLNDMPLHGGATRRPAHNGGRPLIVPGRSARFGRALRLDPRLHDGREVRRVVRVLLRGELH